MHNIYALTAFAALATLAFAAPECKVRVLRPVTDDIGNAWAPVRLLPATILRRQSGRTQFCT